MSNEIKMNGRFIQKHDIEENWNTAARAANPFIPKQGEFIVYDDRYTDNDGEHIVADNVRYKIGDGVHNVEELPFNEDHIVNTLTNQDLIILHEAQSYTDAALNNLDVANNLQIAVTYSELKSLRDNAELIPGMFYRITDYICTTTQEDTQAMSNRFDIIVQALSNNTVSENASADYHYDEEGHIDGYFGIEEGGFRLKALYDIIEDETGESNNQETYKPEDIFIEYGYEENADGDDVPTLFKTDMNNFPDEPDYEDIFYYVGPYEFDGIVYDRWRKIDEDTYTWDNPSKKYVLTEVIVKDGDFDQEALNSHTMTQIVKVANPLAWELKYCLDNDINRFTWADSIDGKGVIYHMTDEYGNECSYDFKNIQFKRYMIVGVQNDQVSDLIGYYLGLPNSMEYTIDATDYKYCYTFSWLNENNDIEDLSIVGNYLSDDGGIIVGTHHNIIQPRTDGSDQLRWKLNDIVFLSEYDWDGGPFYGCYANTFDVGSYSNTLHNQCNEISMSTCCYRNILGTNCYSIIFSQDCSSNILGQDCYQIRFESNCTNNIFGAYCYNNKLVTDCSHNTFGRGAHDNSLDTGCSNNVLGADCTQNTLGKSCRDNVFEYECTHNKLGNDCVGNNILNYNVQGWDLETAHSTYNNLGNYCCSNTIRGKNNTFGNNCSDNSFGGFGGSHDNTFGNNCKSNSAVKNITLNLLAASKLYLSDNCSNIMFSSDSRIKNITVSAGISGTATSPLRLDVTNNTSPVVYEASGTTHIILD